ncbi:MAG: ribose 5-phosphate isomerase B [Clostridiaceae bacterium]|jgi:ribose 5-phosphate isomerase B|nr:ribose 5-phosphate isomerase B [Clostridiaceae bacterium]
MKIALASDHAGYDLKMYVRAHLEAKGYHINDLGVHNKERSDYPVFGNMAAKEVANGNSDLAIIFCGTGIGISIAANKVKGVRCCCCSEPYSARMSRLHNDCNVLAMGGRVVGDELALMIVDEFLATEFEGGRHADRVKLIGELDEY